MSITNYAELQAAVADWMERSDLADRIPDLIRLAEIRIVRKLRLRLMEVEVPLSTTPGSRFVPLPADYREPKALWINWTSGREKLRYVSPAVFDAAAASGAPVYWGIDGANIAFQRPADQAYSLTFRYIIKLALSDAAPTNVLLDAYPDAYLTATLAEAARFLKDPDAADLWDKRWYQISHDIREEEERSRALTTLRTEPGALTSFPGRFDIRRGW